MEVPDCLLDFQSYGVGERCCDGCSKDVVLQTETDVCYCLLNVNSDIDLCSDCYDRLPEILEKKEDDIQARYYICDICFRSIGKTRWHLKDACYDVCNECSKNVKGSFIPLTKEILETKKGVIYNDQGCMYRYDVVDLTVPVELQNRIIENAHMVNLESLVRPPSYDWNAAEWKVISPQVEVPGVDAYCSFAVRCIPDHHQVASVVMDHHGQCAMNIVYENVKDFLEAEEQWISTKPSEEERIVAADAVKKSYDETYGCDDDLMMLATDSFAVYTRLQKNLSLYYG